MPEDDELDIDLDDDLVEVVVGVAEFNGEIRRWVPRDAATHWDASRWSSRPPR
ncbi:hypothetical protein [Rhodococcus sp. EPR-157]|uniref:hypothetical protein n=1 Tax=Rhodococcus sp. EPR-157 TaxID=1813677 RepID=UPI000AC23A22|nr:hypothetical protein [Rhodococcus sp. EPR-157]